MNSTTTSTRARGTGAAAGNSASRTQRPRPSGQDPRRSGREPRQSAREPRQGAREPRQPAREPRWPGRGPGLSSRDLRPPGQPASATRTALLTRGAAESRSRARAAPPRVAPVTVADGPAAGSQAGQRTPFILLLLGLLGGGLVCLLVINTTLAAASFRISDLQKGNVELAQQQQDLQQQVASEESPSTIEQRAYQLGMRPQSVLNMVDLKTGRRYTSPAGAAGAAAVPGYGP